MKTFKIDSKDYDLKFNLGFIRRMDAVYQVNQGGMELGAGLGVAFSYMEMMNPSVLTHIIHCAIQPSQKPPALSRIEHAIDEYAEENGGLEKLFEGLKKQLETSPQTKATIKKFTKNVASANK